MTGTIQTLFSVLDHTSASPAEQRALQEAAGTMERVGKKLTPEEADAVWAAAMQVGPADARECFVRGFRLGARLMLDVLAEDPAGQA